MPLIAIALKFKAHYRDLQRQVDRVMRSELRDRAREVLRIAKSSIRKSVAPSEPGHPFKSKSGATKRMLGTRVSKRTAYVGFRAGKAKARTKAGKKARTVRAVPNILEHGSREMDARPVLEPAVEKAKRHPFRSRL